MNCIFDKQNDDPDFDTQAISEIAGSAVSDTNRIQSNEQQVRTLIAQRRLAVRSIYLPYSPQMDLEDALDEMLDAAPILREAGLPQPAVCLLADSFSGKSTGAKTYVGKTLERLSPGPCEMPVVYVKLDTDGNIGSLASAVLTALGEKRPNMLSADKRWTRAREAIRNRQVSLLIFDEFQRAGRRPTLSPVIAGKILDIMDDGDCACAFLGKTNAIHVFNSCPDLKNRLDVPVKMPALKWITDSERFIQFADAFDQALVDAGVTTCKSGLGEKEIAQCLLESSNGLIGQFSRIIESAVIMITREGYNVITRQDLHDAVQEWSIGNDRIGYNPFSTSSHISRPKAGEQLDDAVDPEDFDEESVR